MRLYGLNPRLYVRLPCNWSDGHAQLFINRLEKALRKKTNNRQRWLVEKAVDEMVKFGFDPVTGEYIGTEKLIELGYLNESGVRERRRSRHQSRDSNRWSSGFTDDNLPQTWASSTGGKRVCEGGMKRWTQLAGAYLRRKNSLFGGGERDTWTTNSNHMTCEDEEEMVKYLVNLECSREVAEEVVSNVNSSRSRERGYHTDEETYNTNAFGGRMGGEDGSNFEITGNRSWDKQLHFNDSFQEEGGTREKDKKRVRQQQEQ